MMKGVSGPIMGSAAAGGGGGAGGGGMQDYGTDGNPAVGQRRPHTAHGARAGFPSSSQQMAGGVYNGAPVDPKLQQQMYDEEVSLPC